MSDFAWAYLSVNPECVFDYKYNDKEIVYDKNIYKKLLKENIEEPVAKHVAHLFIRDTVSLFEETLHPDDENDTDQFENIQSTNWQVIDKKLMTIFENQTILCQLSPVYKLMRICLSRDDFSLPLLNLLFFPSFCQWQ